MGIFYATDHQALDDYGREFEWLLDLLKDFNLLEYATILMFLTSDQWF